MDDIFDQLLSSSWEDINGADRSSLDSSAGGPTNCLPGDSMGTLQASSRVSTMSVTPSSHMSPNLEGQAQNNDVQNSSSSVIAGENTPYLLKKLLVCNQAQNQKDLHDPVMLSPAVSQTQLDSKFSTGGNIQGQGGQKNALLSLQRQFQNNASGGSAVLQLNSTGPVSPHGASQILPVIGCATRGALAMPSSAPVGASVSEASGIQLCHGDTPSPSPVQSHWAQPHMPGVSPITSVPGKGKSEGFILNAEAIQGEGHMLGKRSRQEEDFTERENRSATTGLDGRQGPLLTNYARSQPGQQNTGLQLLQSNQGNSLQQQGNRSVISQDQLAATAGAVLNGAPRTRVRARRGQATDPHSIAERERRERIAKNLKSLQELVPNANKTDKASMLDEIIDYVKFLQLQVKVLSMSRLGGAGAVAPLIADVPAEGSGSLASAALGQAGGSLSQDGLAFEQNVVKLMEKDMTAAMQYLQNKGLCLMPIALATAISSSTGKPLLGSGVTNSVDSTSDRQSSGNQPASLTVDSCSGALGMGSAGFGSDFLLKENTVEKRGRELVPTAESNGAEFGIISSLPKLRKKE